MTKPVLMVIDDDRDITEFVKYVASEADFKVYEYLNAASFQNALKNIKPAIIVMDIVMPDMDGIELLSWLVEQRCSVPIILMSGYDGLYLKVSKELAEAKGNYILDTLSKPFGYDNLLSVLKKSSITRLETQVAT